MNFPAAWEITRGQSFIGILDADWPGFATYSGLAVHPDLQSNFRVHMVSQPISPSGGSANHTVHVAGIIAVAGAVFGILYYHGFAPPAAFAACMATAAGLSIVNGFAIRLLKIPAIIVTLAGMTLFTGILREVHDNRDVPARNMNRAFPAAFSRVGRETKRGNQQQQTADRRSHVAPPQRTPWMLTCICKR